MRDKRRQAILLGCLLLGWVALLAVRLQSGPEMAARPGPRAAGARLGGAPGTPEAAVPQLKLELLDRALPPFQEARHNIFGGAQLTPPPPASAPSVEVKAPPATPAAPPPDPFLEGTRGLRFLGFVAADGDRAAIVGKGTEVFVVKERETLDGAYLVKEVHEDYVLLGQPQGDRTVRLTLAAEPAPKR